MSEGLEERGQPRPFDQTMSQLMVPNYPNPFPDRTGSLISFHALAISIATMPNRRTVLAIETLRDAAANLRDLARPFNAHAETLRIPAAPMPRP